MKYIRTKDGRIYEVAHGIKRYGHEDSVLVFIDGFLVDVYEMGIIEKQADTIEELCDEFVVFDGHRLVIVDNDYDFVSGVATKQRKPIIYGALLTEKGIIYVAKMNEKGEELELL